MKNTRLVVISWASAATLAAVVGYTTVSAVSEPDYSSNAAGQTYGPLSPDREALPIEGIPDLVKVIGDHGKDGYARASELLGVGESAPDSPEDAREQEAADKTHTIPVYESDGKTQIDVFTVIGTDAGGVIEVPADR